jgi:hypothetical protein
VAVPFFFFFLQTSAYFLVRKDDYAFFLKPVDTEKVLGYLDVITQPMDFGTMTEKVVKSRYRSLDEFAVRTQFQVSSHALSPPQRRLSTFIFIFYLVRRKIFAS